MAIMHIIFVTTIKQPQDKKPAAVLVEATGFEPTTLWSRTIRATNCATPRYDIDIICLFPFSVK